jgi:DNA repair protein SbcD/Mre11
MPYRFVHAADIHLDSPLRSLALRDPELAELIGNATRRAFVGIIDLCLSEQVDALLLAGDLYDGDQTSMKTARFLAEQVRRLHAAGVQVFVIRGNHDALSRITKELTFPDSVTVFGGRADAIQVDRSASDFPVVIHGISFARPHILESLLPRFKAPVDGAINIGLMHTSLDGAKEHDDYAPCSLSDLDNSGFDYWALGHIHKRSVARGRCTIVMPGMPQGRDVNESGAKSVTLVTIADDRSIHLEERITSAAQFEFISIDLTGIEDWRDMVTMLAKTIQRRRDDVPAEHMVARLHFTGSTPLAWRLRYDHDLLKTEASDRAFVIGKSWIEKVEIECHAPNTIQSQVIDPMTELRRLIEEEIRNSSAYQTEISNILDELRSQLPPECRHVLGSDEASSRGVAEKLVTEGSEDVLALLHAKAVSEET